MNDATPQSAQLRLDSFDLNLACVAYSVFASTLIDVVLGARCSFGRRQTMQNKLSFLPCPVALQQSPNNKPLERRSDN